MSFPTISAILRGRWLIDQSWATNHLPLVIGLLKGNAPDFGVKKDASLQPVKYGSTPAPVYNVYIGSNLDTLPTGSVAIVKIAGPMLKYGDMCSYGMVDKANLINKLGSNDRIAAILLDIDSPGGQVDGTSILGDSILRARQKKPIVSIIDDGMAASAGYWIASCADEIYVTQQTDMVGSVGVYCTIADYKKHYAEYYKLPVMEVYAPQSTEKNLEYIEALAGNDELLKEDLRVIADQFIKTVKRNRGARLTSDEWNKGKMFYAKDAIRIGLIDGVKSYDQVLQRINSLINN